MKSSTRILKWEYCNSFFNLHKENEVLVSRNKVSVCWNFYGKFPLLVHLERGATSLTIKYAISPGHIVPNSLAGFVSASLTPYFRIILVTKSTHFSRVDSWMFTHFFDECPSVNLAKYWVMHRMNIFPWLSTRGVLVSEKVRNPESPESWASVVNRGRSDLINIVPSCVMSNL